MPCAQTQDCKFLSGMAFNPDKLVIRRTQRLRSKNVGIIDVCRPHEATVFVFQALLQHPQEIRISLFFKAPRHTVICGSNQQLPRFEKLISGQKRSV